MPPGQPRTRRAQKKARNRAALAKAPDRLARGAGVGLGDQGAEPRLTGPQDQPDEGQAGGGERIGDGRIAAARIPADQPLRAKPEGAKVLLPRREPDVMGQGMEGFGTAIGVKPDLIGPQMAGDWSLMVGWQKAW